MSLTGTPSTDTSTLASAANLALVAAETEKTEHHLHNVERWVGAKAIPTATEKWDTGSMIPFRVTSGNDDWGPWTQIKGVDDDIGISGQVRADIHRIIIPDVSASKKTHRVRIGNGSSGAAALAAGSYSEFMALPEKDGKASPVDVMANRGTIATSIVWAQVWVSGENAATLDFFMGVHGYEG